MRNTLLRSVRPNDIDLGTNLKFSPFRSFSFRDWKLIPYRSACKLLKGRPLNFYPFRSVLKKTNLKIQSSQFLFVQIHQKFILLRFVPFPKIHKYGGTEQRGMLFACLSVWETFLTAFIPFLMTPGNFFTDFPISLIQSPEEHMEDTEMDHIDESEILKETNGRPSPELQNLLHVDTNVLRPESSKCYDVFTFFFTWK